MEDYSFSMFSTISVGIFTGVLTSILIGAITLSFSKIIVPWYRALVYQGLDISGTWEGEQIREGRGEFRFTLRLEQKAQALTGTFISVDDYPDGKKDIHEYLVSGKINDGWVLLSYCNKDRQSMGLGSLLLQVRDAGKELSGGIIFLRSKNVSVGVDGELNLRKK